MSCLADSLRRTPPQTLVSITLLYGEKTLTGTVFECTDTTLFLRRKYDAADRQGCPTDPHASDARFDYASAQTNCKSETERVIAIDLMHIKSFREEIRPVRQKKLACHSRTPVLSRTLSTNPGYWRNSMRPSSIEDYDDMLIKKRATTSREDFVQKMVEFIGAELLLGDPPSTVYGCYPAPYRHFLMQGHSFVVVEYPLFSGRVDSHACAECINRIIRSRPTDWDAYSRSTMMYGTNRLLTEDEQAAGEPTITRIFHPGCQFIGARLSGMARHHCHYAIVFLNDALEEMLMDLHPAYVMKEFLHSGAVKQQALSQQSHAKYAGNSLIMSLISGNMINDPHAKALKKDMDFFMNKPLPSPSDDDSAYE